jgi:hypothetical protein
MVLSAWRGGRLDVGLVGAGADSPKSRIFWCLPISLAMNVRV